MAAEVVSPMPRIWATQAIAVAHLKHSLDVDFTNPASRERGRHSGLCCRSPLILWVAEDPHLSEAPIHDVFKGMQSVRRCGFESQVRGIQCRLAYWLPFCGDGPLFQNVDGVNVFNLEPVNAVSREFLSRGSYKLSDEWEQLLLASVRHGFGDRHIEGAFLVENSEGRAGLGTLDDAIHAEVRGSRFFVLNGAGNVAHEAFDGHSATIRGILLRILLRGQGCRRQKEKADR
jgi:hypothetical protein